VSVDAFPLIAVAGDARTRGRQYGEQARSRIEVSLEIYGRAFDRLKMSWDEVARRARAFMPRIEAYDAEALAEMAGIAEGAGLTTEHIVALNARTELLYGGDAPPKQDQAEGCTAAVVMPEATKDRKLLHGQNWDWIEDCARSAIVLRADPGDGNPYLSFMEAGMLARCGLNRAGIALTGNFLASDRDSGRNGVPIPLIRRRVLRAREYGKAIGVVYEAPRAFSNNMMLSTAAGAAIDLEASPDEVFWLKPDDGLLVHANHFKAPGALAKVKDVGILASPDTLYRDDRVQQKLAAKRGQITVADLQRVFLDKFGTPAAVCREPTPGPGGANAATVATIVMRPEDGRMWIAPVPYRGANFTEYALED
jgi:isopenicillin-N N-acyltransferase like protein